MRVLIVGGYGTFGGRIVELLESDARLTLIVAGRSLERAETFCAARGTPRATLAPARFDRDGDLAAQLAALRPDLIVDASGPFQAYGEQPYRLIEAAIRARVHYLDLADGADFVSGVGVFDAAARQAGICVLSGVSSFPVLTAAVVRRLSGVMTRLDEITAGIAPSPYAGVGENVVRAIAIYAGQPVAHLGRTAKVIGRPFTQQRRYIIAPPGKLPLNSTMFSLVDVPDLRVLPELWPELRRIWIGAGPAPEILHRALAACAWAVRLGWVRSLAPLAPLMFWATNHLRWGEHRGGMFLELKGLDSAGKPRTLSWHLLAEGDDGPLIPSMAVQAIVLKYLDGGPPRVGARACVSDIELDDYERLFARRTIYAGVRSSAPAEATLYQRVLGDAWARLPPAVRAMHDVLRVAVGEASVEGGANPLAWIAAQLMGFPASTQKTAVSVDFERKEGAETWTRRFGAYRFASRQVEGAGKSARLLVERFGVLDFAMALVLEEGRLHLVLRRWGAFGVSLPLWLAPRTRAYEEEAEGRFRFFVEISHPLCGLIVRYQGWLAPAEP